MADAPGTPPAQATPPVSTPPAPAVTPPAPAATLPAPAVTPPAAVAPTGIPTNVTKIPDAPPTPEADPFASLKPENKQLVEKSGWKSLDAVVESYNALRNDIRNKVLTDLPADATPAQREEWNKSRGRPEVAVNYTLSMPQEMPKDMPYDGTFAEKFKEWSYEIGLTPWQADAMHGRYVAMMADGFKAAGTGLNESVQKSHTELQAAWGQEGSDKYQKNVEMATRAIRHLDPGLNDALKRIGVLMDDGTVVEASVAKALAVAGHKLFSEDTLFGSGTTEIQNPWAKGKENLTEQGRIYKADPERARRLARAAGANPTF